MQFTHDEKMYLFSRLPPLELSYEPKLHKKVQADIYYIIPKGPKALVWYTYWQDQNVCLLITLNERGNYSDIKLFPAVFSMPLALGTIIYGTYFNMKKMHYFTCEHLYYYKGLAVHKQSLPEKMALLADFFKHDVEQIAYTNDFLVVGLPVMTATYEDALQVQETLPYRAYGIGCYKQVTATKPLAIIPRQSIPGTMRPSLHTQPPSLHTSTPSLHTSTPSLHTSTPSLHTQPPPPGGARACFAGGSTPRVWKVKATLAADIYELYTKDDTLVGTAMVPSYKSSVMLNSLFRKIKENANLDLLEESDDEEEFENNETDKFVDLSKTILMECVFLKKFQKWQPVKVI
jgi:hypothetical protein